MKEKLFLLDTSEIIQEGQSDFKAIFWDYYDKYLKLIDKSIDYDDIEDMVMQDRLYISVYAKDKSAIVYIHYEEEYHTIYLKFIDVFRHGNDKKYVAEFTELIDI